MRVVMFCFAGRQPNMQLQLPHIKRILDENPNIEYHLWDLARNPQDSAWLRTVKHTRLTVRTEYAGERPWERFKDVYHHYSTPEYADTLFIKLDDDIVFIETRRINTLIDAATENPDSIISAKVINNGACTRTEPDLWHAYTDLRLRLLDVHVSPKYARLCHQYFIDNWTTLIEQPQITLDCNDWLSINCIAYNHTLAQRIHELLDQPSPRTIAGRSYNPSRHRIGDEGACNMLPRKIVQGFLACHLYFGPQANKMSDNELDTLRTQYKRIGQLYLDNKHEQPVEHDTITVCIPWRHTDSRKAAFDRCIDYWHNQHQFRVIAHDSNIEQSWLCGQARNNAVHRADTDIIIVADADTLPADIQQIDKAITLVATAQADIVWPFTIYRQLTADAVNDNNLDNSTVTREYTHGSPGGIIVANRRAFWSIGGYDEQFEPGAWGFDDDAFMYAAQTLLNTRRLTGIVYSFDHDVDEYLNGRGRDLSNNNPNKRRWRQFHQARGNRARMRQLINTKAAAHVL